MAAGNAKEAGFTLIELLVATVVAAILAIIVVPSFHNILESNQFDVEYNEVLSGLYFARSEAIKRRDNITVTVDQVGGSWELVVTDSSENQLMVAVGEDGDVAVPSGAVTFNKLGYRASCSWTDCTVNITSASESEAMEVNVTGRITKSA